MSTIAIGGRAPGFASGGSGTKKKSDCVRPGVFDVRARFAVSDDGVDEARLADVGAPGEGDLRRPLRRQRRNVRRLGHEAPGMAEEIAHVNSPCGFALRPLRQGKGSAHVYSAGVSFGFGRAIRPFRLPKSSIGTPFRFMMTPCWSTESVLFHAQ